MWLCGEVLVFFEDGARFLKTPVLKAERNKTIKEADIKILVNGAINVRIKETFWGWAGSEMREALKSIDPQERIEVFKDMINQECPGSTFERLSISSLDDLSLPLSIEYGFSNPDYVKQAGDLLIFHVPGLTRDLEGVAKEERIHPLIWDNTDSNESRISIQIRERYRISYLPESFEINLPFASYRLEYTNSGGKIQLETSEEQRARTIQVDQYPTYKEYEEKIAKELEKLIILERIG